jgi:hypothetical protein
LKSASARWSGNYPIKKTSDSPCVFEENKPEGNQTLSDGYEKLRDFILSPVKVPSQPLGLDLWLKRGFLSWGRAMSRRDLPLPRRIPERPQNDDISDGLVMSLSNILAEWSDKNVRRQNQERAFNP